MHMLVDLSAGRQTRMPGTSGMKHCSSTPKHTPWQWGLGERGKKRNHCSTAAITNNKAITDTNKKT